MVELTNQTATDSLFSNDPLLSFSTNQTDQISNFFTNTSSLLLGNSTNSSRLTNHSDLSSPTQAGLTNTNSLDNNLSTKNIIFISETPYISRESAPSLLSSSLTIQAASTTGITYYISPTGNDKNSGTSPTSAWKSISKINGKTFNPGDKILFQGGSTFSGNLSFDVNDKGTATSPITISSYGTGQAIINGGTGTGISLYNTAGYEITNLKIVGAGATSNTGNGICFYMDLANNTKLEYIKINNLEVSGFGNDGVNIGSWNNQSGFRNVNITNVLSHDNAKAGIGTYAQLPNTHQNVYIGYVKAYNNLGVAGDPNPTGSGIVLGGVNGGTVERSLAYNNGSLCNASGGPVGIWAWDSTGIVIQYNESYNNRTGGGADGGGFDLDQNVSNSIMQYNYSHNNDGAGYLLCQGVNNQNFTNNIVRYNISENDGRKNGYAGISLYGRVRNTEIYNNTVFMRASTVGTPKAIDIGNAGAESLDVSGVHIRNNIFQTQNGLALVSVSASQINGATDLIFQGNNYYSSGATFKINWNSTIYNNLNTWYTATTQENLGGQNVGLSVDPLFNNPGAGITLGNTNLLNTFNAYTLGSTSPLIDRGLNLMTLFNVNPGTQDFNGTSIPQGLGYDLGADESF